MSKLSQTQKEQLKRCVIDCTVRRLTLSEMHQYIIEKMQVDISTDYLRHIKSSLRKDAIKQLTIYQKDKFAYLDQLFFKRVAELESSQDILRNIIANNADKPEAQIKAVAQLNEITRSLSDMFDALPLIIKSAVVDEFPPLTATATATTTLESPDLSKQVT
jgi:hypothetical protein